MGMVAGKKGVKHDINITPYIDILLVLLIIFMVAAPLKKHDQEIKVPKPAPATMPKDVKPDMIVVDVKSDHTILLNSKPIALENLGAMLSDVFSRRANKNMFIRGESAIPYGEVFQVLDVAKRSGVADIALIDTGDKSAPTNPAAQNPARGAP
jgi:biopolymer transport protein ExbD